MIEYYQFNLQKRQQNYLTYNGIACNIISEKQSLGLMAFDWQTRPNELNFEGKYYRPIIERNLGHFALRYQIYSEVADSVFFSYSDRRLALELIHPPCRSFLNEFNYAEMSDSEAIDFMCKRLKEREKFARHCSKNKTRSFLII